MTIFARILLISLFSMIATATHAVSFDCQKASSFVEKAICQSSKLSNLDDELALAYQAAQDVSKDTDSLKKQQLNWLKNKRNICQTNSCLEKAYKKRITSLSKLSAVDRDEGAELENANQ